MTIPDDVTHPALDPTPTCLAGSHPNDPHPQTEACLMAGERPAYDDWPEDGNFILRADAEAALTAERELREQAEAGWRVQRERAEEHKARSERYRAALKEVHNRLMTWSIERFKANDHLTSGVLEELARILYDEVLTDAPESGADDAVPTFHVTAVKRLSGTEGGGGT